MSHNKLQWNCCDKVTVTKWERWVRGRVGVPVHIGSRKITQVSSGMNYKYSYSFIYKFGDNRNFRCSSNSAPNQFAHEEFKLSTVEFQTFRSWSGQTKHLTTRTLDTRGLIENQHIQDRVLQN